MSTQSREPVNRVAEAMGAGDVVSRSHASDVALVSTSAAHNALALQDQKLQQRWNHIVCKELRIPNNYGKAAVLMIHWAEHLDRELKCGEELKELRSLFNDGFKFKCEDVVALDTKKRPQIQLENAVTNFVCANDGSHRQNLLIVYYTGHGWFKEGNDGDSGQLYVAGTKGPEEEANDGSYPPEAQWDPAERTLRDAEADVLLILDCCFAGSVMKDSRRDLRAFQTLAATGPDDMATEPGKRSYTRKLIDALKNQLEKNHSNPFSIYDLNQEINRLKNWRSKAQVYNRIAGCARPIRLAPIQPDTLEKQQQQLVPTGSVELRLTFSSDPGASLSMDQVDRLAKNVTNATKKSGINVCTIDWIKSERHRKKSHWDKALMCTRSAYRFIESSKNKRRREEDHDHDGREAVDVRPRKRSMASKETDRSWTF